MHQALEESYVREFIIYVTGISHFLRIIAKQLTSKEMIQMKRNKSNETILHGDCFKRDYTEF